MTEKEIIKHAKDYIDSLANGTNPLTGEPVNESDVVNISSVQNYKVAFEKWISRREGK